MEFKDRIQQRMSALKLNATDISKRVGVSKTTVSFWLSGQNGAKGKNLLALAEALQCSADWLETGRGDPGRTESNVTPASQAERPMKSYPVISDVVAGDWAESCDNHQPGDAEEWIESDKRAGECGYWLNVNGDSMLPNFPHGSRILVQPEGFDLISGKFYVALIYEPGHRRETTFKQYVRDSGIEYLRPLNNDFRTLEITPSVRIIGRVIDFRPPRGLL